MAALSNYQVLNNNVNYVNNLFRESLSWLSEISNETRVFLENDSLVSSEAKDNTCPLYYFRKILPRLVINGIQISQKFQNHTIPDDRNNVTVENVYLLHKSFADYSELVTSTRQFIDSLVYDSYQMVCLEPKLLNYQVLSSLSSFEKYATKSIWHSIANDNLIKALQIFRVQQQIPCVLSLVREYKSGKIKKRLLEAALVTIEKFHFFFCYSIFVIRVFNQISL